MLWPSDVAFCHYKTYFQSNIPGQGTQSSKRQRRGSQKADNRLPTRQASKPQNRNRNPAR